MAEPAGRTQTAEHLDGRHAWRERNRSAVVDALLDLYEEGNVDPGAQEIAERSGVSRRSVFRYFDDMDDLCRVAIERHQERVGHLFEIEGLGEGTLAARIERIVEQRMKLFEAIAPVRRVARLRAPFQPVIAAELARANRELRRQLERHFLPDLDAMPSDRRAEALAALDMLCAFESFELLRFVQELSLEQAGSVLRRTIATVFDGQ
jgi:AcrR family transcriptional regulator